MNDFKQDDSPAACKQEWLLSYSKRPVANNSSPLANTQAEYTEYA